MIDYYENEDGDRVIDQITGSSYPISSSYYTSIIQPLIDAVEAQIIPWAGSAGELNKSIATKQQEVREHYETLHGESLASVVKRQAAASPSVVTTANAITNIAIADGGIAAIAALIDKATVDAYSVVGLAWS